MGHADLCLGWVRSRCGPGAKPFSPPISRGWCWPAARREMPIGFAGYGPDGRVSHSVLFHSSRNARLAAGVAGGSRRLPRLLTGKVVCKIFGLYPVIGLFRRERNERWYYTLLMSTGLTFGTISALYGLTHGIVTQEQYSFLVAAVIASAVVPTVIAGLFFSPPTSYQNPIMRKKQPGESMVSVTKARSGSFKNFRNAWPEIGSLTEVLPNECLD